MDSQKKPSSRLPSFASPRGFKGFLQEVQAEMKKVTWPRPQETTRLTGVVATVCGMVIVLLFGLSFAADAILKVLIRGGN